MKNNHFSTEGSRLYTKDNLSYISNLSGLERAMNDGAVLEAMAMLCDGDLNLHVDLFGIKGIIPKEECVFSPCKEPVKDIAIITRVGKPVCFKVRAIEPQGDTFRAILSRREAQAECYNYYLSSLIPGDIIPATVTHLDNFGAFVDIGCGLVSLLSIDCISLSRISHPSDRLSVGQKLNVAVRSNNAETGRIYVTLKELLGTWEENAASFCAGQTVFGIVRSIESYGIFVELAPNLTGLAEPKDANPIFRDIKVGDGVSVYIKSILPDRMKIKLVLIDVNPSPPCPAVLKYYTDAEHMDIWRYSPEGCTKTIETDFTE